MADLFIFLYTDEDITSFLRLILRLMNSLSADEMRNQVVYLQQFK